MEMTEAPERIWAWWFHRDQQDDVMQGGWTSKEDAREQAFIRLDAHEAAVAAARKEGMLAARDIALADEANDWTDGVPRGGIIAEAIAEAIDDAISAEASK
jgi:hypothetical protein